MRPHSRTGRAHRAGGTGQAPQQTGTQPSPEDTGAGDRRSKMPTARSAGSHCTGSHTWSEGDLALKPASGLGDWEPGLEAEALGTCQTRGASSQNAEPLWNTQATLVPQTCSPQSVQDGWEGAHAQNTQGDPGGQRPQTSLLIPTSTQLGAGGCGRVGATSKQSRFSTGQASFKHNRERDGEMGAGRARVSPRNVRRTRRRSGCPLESETAEMEGLKAGDGLTFFTSIAFSF